MPRTSWGRPSIFAAPGDVAVGEQATGVGGRVDGAAGRGLEPHPQHLEAELATHALQHLDVATARPAEVEVGAHDDDAGVRRAHQHLAHEVLGGLAAAGLVEVEHVHHVEVAGGREQLELLLRGGEQQRRGIGPHHLGRMTVEGDAHRGETARVGQLAHQTEHRVVTEMDTVVHADGDDRPAGGRHRRDRVAQFAELTDHAHGHVGLPRVSPAGATTTAGRRPDPRFSYTASSSPPPPTSA